jgi:hypothetical protein
MRLLLPVLLLFGYISASLVLPLPWRWPVRAAAMLAVLAVCAKFFLYEAFGGSFFAPDLPRPLLLVMEALFAAAVVLFALLLLKDALHLLLWAGRLAGASWALPVSRAALGGGLVAVALGLGAWGAWQGTRVPEVRTVEIGVPGLPPALDGLSVVQLSDLHVGPILGRDWLRAVVERTNALRPDLVALTGDMVDGLTAQLGGTMAPLADLRAAHGVFGINGNHEYYFRAGQWGPFFESQGITMLDNAHRTLTVDGAPLVVAGVTDTVEQRFGGPGPDLRAALDGAPEATTILLNHRPDAPGPGARVHVQLSGHTHGGTMVFLQPLVARYNGGHVKGLYHAGGTALYVSPGTGIWAGFPCRIGVPAEITRIVLRAG